MWSKVEGTIPWWPALHLLEVMVKEGSFSHLAFSKYLILSIRSNSSFWSSAHIVNDVISVSWLRLMWSFPVCNALTFAKLVVLFTCHPVPLTFLHLTSSNFFPHLSHHHPLQLFARPVTIADCFLILTSISLPFARILSSSVNICLTSEAHCKVFLLSSRLL